MKKLPGGFAPLICALLLCLANVFKPAVIDDLAYLWYARQIVQTPALPFGLPPDGFYLIWYEHGQSSFSLLTPMVVPYWLALGIRFLGENLVVLKLWLFPFCLMFTLSLASLLRRFAPRLEKELLFLTVLSPTFLPSLNLMVDMPAVAFALAAIACFLSALDNPGSRWRTALISGILAGLAGQTKYPGITATALIALATIQRRQWLLGLVASTIAVCIFAGWEVYLTQAYGRSHFLVQVDQRRNKPQKTDEKGFLLERVGNEVVATIEKKAGLATPLAGYVGGLIPLLIPLTLLGFRCRPAISCGAMFLLFFEFLMMAIVPNQWGRLWHDPHNDDEFSISTIVVGINGICLLILMGVACAKLCIRGWNRRRIQMRHDKKTLLLIGWLGIELVAYFALSPFGATRRVMSIVIVSTLIVGRLLSLIKPTNDARRAIRMATVLGIVYGLTVAWTDFRDAMVERSALRDSIDWIDRRNSEHGAIWYTGHWGFQYYAEQAGLKPVFPDESVLEEGDWLIYPDSLIRPYGQMIILEPPFAEKEIVIEWYERWPLRTNPDFYSGYLPIRHHEGHRIRVTIFRIKKHFLARPV